MKIISAITILWLLLGNVYGFCQSAGVAENDTLVGWVVNTKGKGVKNIPVTIHSKEGVVRTNKKGLFTFQNISLYDTLMLVIPKNKIYHVPISGLPYLKITVRDDDQYTIDEARQAILNTGYVQKERRLSTSSDIVISGDELRQTGLTDLLQALTGKVAGLDMDYSGSGERAVYIRGKGTFNGSSVPLYIINGMIVESLEMVDIDTIKEVTVMKNASSYGSRGANGAIIVTTK